MSKIVGCISIDDKRKVVNFTELRLTVVSDPENRIDFQNSNIKRINNILAERQRFDKWISIVKTIKINFSTFNSFPSTFLSLLDNENKEEWKAFVEKIDRAVTNYSCTERELPHIKPISDESGRSFLYLVPIFSKYHPRVSIDADTGYFAATFTSGDQGMMTVMVTERGYLHYSLAERGVRLVKISGTAKIKDPHDLEKVYKILSML